MVYYYVCYLVIICTNIFDTIIQNKIDYKRYASKRNFFKNIEKSSWVLFSVHFMHCNLIKSVHTVLMYLYKMNYI